MQEKEQAYSVFLRTECDGETDRIFARAEKKEKGFVFQKDGTTSAFRIAGRRRICALKVRET